MLILIRLATYFSLINRVILLDSYKTCLKFDLYSYYTKEYQQICYSHGCYCVNEHLNKIYSLHKIENEEMASNSGLNGLYRPRSALARALYEKQRNDRHLQEFDQHEVR